MKNISLDKNKAVVFFGSMNAFPMMYALQIKKYGYEVLYLVDAPPADTLSRPENHYPAITYPYPDWIIEWTLSLQILLLLSPKFFARLLTSVIKKHTKSDVGCYVLNGFFISLAPYLPKSTIFALSHGSDLDVWADTEHIEELRGGVFQSRLMKKIPKPIQRYLLKNFISKQEKGFQSSDYLCYMPPKFNRIGDKVIAELQQKGVVYIPRSQASFSSLTGQNRKYRENSQKRAHW